MGMDYIPVYDGDNDEGNIVKVIPGKVQRTGCPLGCRLYAEDHADVPRSGDRGTRRAADHRAFGAD